MRLDGVGLSSVVGRHRVHRMWLPTVLELLASQLAELRARESELPPAFRQNAVRDAR